MKYKIAVNDQKFEVEIKDIKEGIAQVNVNGQPFDSRAVRCCCAGNRHSSDTGAVSKTSPDSSQSVDSGKRSY